MHSIALSLLTQEAHTELTKLMSVFSPFYCHICTHSNPCRQIHLSPHTSTHRAHTHTLTHAHIHTHTHPPTNTRIQAQTHIHQANIPTTHTRFLTCPYSNTYVRRATSDTKRALLARMHQWLTDLTADEELGTSSLFPLAPCRSLRGSADSPQRPISVLHALFRSSGTNSDSRPSSDSGHAHSYEV